MTANLRDMEGVLFDLDGVLTPTAALHAAAWKITFDEALGELKGKGGASQRPFDDNDDRLYVDGRRRSDGVRSFLASRGIALPEDDSTHPTSRFSVAGLARQKAELFQQRLTAGGITAFSWLNCASEAIAGPRTPTRVLRVRRRCR